MSANALMLSHRYGGRTASTPGMSLGDLYGAVDDMLDSEFGEEFEEEDDAFGDDEEEYGLLGIALTKKSRQKKWLDKIVELSKKNKALRKMKSDGAQEATRRSRKGIAGIGKKTVDVEDQIKKNNEDLVKAKKEFLQAGGTESQVKSALRALPGHTIATRGPGRSDEYGAQTGDTDGAARAFTFSVGMREESARPAWGGGHFVFTPSSDLPTETRMKSQALLVAKNSGVKVVAAFVPYSEGICWFFFDPKTQGAQELGIVSQAFFPSERSAWGSR